MIVVKVVSYIPKTFDGFIIAMKFMNDNKLDVFQEFHVFQELNVFRVCFKVCLFF